jgi:hypothetical protein
MFFRKDAENDPDCTPKTNDVTPDLVETDAAKYGVPLRFDDEPSSLLD